MIHDHRLKREFFLSAYLARRDGKDHFKWQTTSPDFRFFSIKRSSMVPYSAETGKERAVKFRDQAFR